MNNFERTAKWLKACGKEPNAEAASVQIGCHIEEFVEFLRTLRCPSEGFSLLVQRTATDLAWFAGKLKSQEQRVYIEPHHRAEALDALCDSEVTGNGVAYMLGMDKPAADAAVLASNDAKLVDGQPVILPGGKIGKPEGWTGPDLRPFV